MISDFANIESAVRTGAQAIWIVYGAFLGQVRDPPIANLRSRAESRQGADENPPRNSYTSLGHVPNNTAWNAGFGEPPVGLHKRVLRLPETFRLLAVGQLAKLRADGIGAGALYTNPASYPLLRRWTSPLLLQNILNFLPVGLHKRHVFPGDMQTGRVLRLLENFRRNHQARLHDDVFP